MKRSNRIALLAGLIGFLPFLASCQALNTTAHPTPSPKALAKGPAVAYSHAPPVNLSACATGSTNEPLAPYAMKMTTSNVGWALGQCTLGARPSFANGSTVQCMWPESELSGILRTSDGGATWIDVSPPSVPNRTWHHAQFFLDATHAWVGEVSRTADACASQLTTFITSDGGRTWQRGGTIALNTAAPTDDVFNVFGPRDGIDFADTQHGWLMVTSPPSAPLPGGNVDSVTLYTTSDGGLHWRLVVSSPGKSSCQPTWYSPMSDVSFVSSTAGWLALACPAVTVLTTRDGGATWTARPAPNCNACSAFQPLDVDHAVITGQRSSPVMLATADAGASWTTRQVPSTAAAQFSFTDPSHGWMVGIEQLPTSYDTVVYRTSDGGQTWSLVGKPGFATATSSPTLYYPIEFVQFTDANTGYVVLGQEAGPQGVTDPTAPQLQMLNTADGGRTWNTVLKQIPASPCSGNYSRLNRPGSGPVYPARMASPTIGWATGGLRTTDGGVYWRDVSPPALRAGASTGLYPLGYSDFYLDGDHAWQAAVYGSGASCSDHASTFATADGGKTWKQSDPIELQLPAGEQVGRMQLGFTTPQAGWLLVSSGPQNSDPLSFSASESDLYTTSDGGLTWAQVSSFGDSLKRIPAPTDSQNCKPSPGQIMFSSSAVGWVSLDCAASQFMVSRDGGATWKVTTFPVSGIQCPCYSDLPTFADASHGLVVVSSEGGVSAASLLLSTSDAGLSWRPTGRPGTGYVLQLDALDANHLFALVTPPGWSKASKVGLELHSSIDGGATWNLVTADVPATWPPGFMQFVDSNHGFESNVNGAQELLVTADGGRSWKSIAPAVQ